MKKLIYSTLGLILAGSLILSGCKKDDNNTTTPTPETPKPVITFINTSGYTFISGKALNTLPTSALKFGMVVSSTIDLKNVKVTRNYQGSGEVEIYSKTLPSGLATYTVDIYDTLKAGLKGAYVYTFSSTDKDATLGTSQLVITATGPLFELTDQKVYNNKGINEGAYDMVQGIAISTTGANKTIMDIYDMSTTSTIAKSWGVGAGCTTMFIKGPFSQQYSQINTEDQVKALWDANEAKATNTLTNMTGLGLMVLVKVIRTGTPIYYVMTIDDIVDGSGADNDYTQFTYKY